MSKLKNRILDWRVRRSWLNSIKYYAGDLLTSSLRSELHKARPECWSDNLSWLPGYSEIVPEFSSRLMNYYTHLKGSHGCRPTDLSSYYEHGLRGQNKSEIHKAFRGIFSDRPAVEIENAIQQFESRGAAEGGKIWFLTRDNDLVKDCGHYLIQGSEYLMSLAAALCDSRHGVEDYRFRLRRFGIPTIFEVDIPTQYVPKAQHDEIARLVISEWGQLVTRRHLGADEAPCYVVRCDIPPQHIVAHHHPSVICDPHRGHVNYINKLNDCDLCRNR